MKKHHMHALVVKTVALEQNDRTRGPFWLFCVPKVVIERDGWGHLCYGRVAGTHRDVLKLHTEAF